MGKSLLTRSIVAGAACAIAAVVTLAISQQPVAAQPAVDKDYAVTWIAGFQGTLPKGVVLRFGSDGRFSGFGGCNRLSGSYSRTGETLTLASPARTRVLCEADVMSFEDAFVTTLAKSTAQQIGDEVVLSADGQRLVVLK
jgi:heat shock protein HslJ